MNRADASTIVACATGHAPATRALIRLSGPACPDLLTRLFHSPEGARSPLTARLRLTATLDLPCLAWLALAPRTYTGEPTLELLIPGNPLVVERVIDRLTTEPGVRAAGPGEFTARAYLNGRISLEEAEGIASLISAGNSEQLAAAAGLLSGQTGSVYRAWSERCTDLLALVEAGIDFSDQEGVVAISGTDLAARVGTLIEEIGRHLNASAGREAPTGRWQVALVGPPNAGKSTLFNALLGRQRAVVAPLAGTTRDVLREPLTIDTGSAARVEIDLLDLAGFDHQASGMDLLAQRAASEALQNADLLLLCVAGGDWPAPTTAGKPVIRVRTKADRPSTLDTSAHVRVCALSGEGLDTLRALITQSLGQARLATTPPRHAAALREALTTLSQIHQSAGPEINAQSLRSTLDALGEITGTVPPDEVIGRVFAAFCIGK